MSSRTWKRTGSLLFALSLVLAGCQGDKGSQGEPGPRGDQGPPGTAGTPGTPGAPGSNSFFTNVELCAACHGGTLGAKHALAEGDAVVVKPRHWNASGGAVKVDLDGDPATPTEQAPEVSVDATTHDVTIRFHVTVNGVVRNDFIQKASVMQAHNEDAFWVYDAAQKAGVRTKLCGATATATCNAWSVEAIGNGNYTATITGFTAAPAAGTTFMLNITPPNGPVATAVVTWGDLTHDAVSDQACINCHGNHIWRGRSHDVTNALGIGPCVVCHNRTGAVETRLTGYIPAPEGSPSGTPPQQEPFAATAGTGLMGIVHGIHNSHNMPGETFKWVWPSNGNTVRFSKGFPGNMNNCATCHGASDTQLAAVMAAPTSYALCLSCHGDFSAFPGAPSSHADFTPLEHSTVAGGTCATCHSETVADWHNGQVTERAGLIWDGADQSVVLAKTIQLDITGVKVNGTNLEVTWTAKDPRPDGAAYDPCNQDFTAGKPVFLGANPQGRTEGCTNTEAGCKSNMSILQAYGLADDWVNEGIGAPPGAPGQPSSTNLNDPTKPINTTCADNVATSIVPLAATAATKGIVALQGKPQVLFAPSGTVIWVRAKTPTREFVVATGELPGQARRQIVSVDKCNACHLGTLYQHGGSRVDSIELCVMCHNPASSEQNRRNAIGIDAAAAYDGLPGQTYDLRYMVHAIHSAGAEYGPSPGYDSTTREQIPGPLLDPGRPLMYYRSNGIFFFGSKEALADIATWPLNAAPESCVTCTDVEDGVLTYCQVYGASTTGSMFSAAADGSCLEADSTSGTWRPHRIIEVHYPRAINDCSACHVGSDPGLPDPAQAVAVTYDTGETPWNSLANDVLMGPSTASCMSCHQSGDPVTQFGLRTHAYGQGWVPTTFDGGRQALIDAASKLP